MLRFAHNGSEAEGAELLARMLETGEVILSGVGAMPYTNADAIHQDPTDPLPVWEKGALLRELSCEAVDALLDAAGPDTNTTLSVVKILGPTCRHEFWPHPLLMFGLEEGLPVVAAKQEGEPVQVAA